MRMPEYEIFHDRDGWYVAMSDGVEYAPQQRFTTYAGALKQRAEWEREDQEALSEESK